MGHYFLNSKQKLTKEQIGGKGFYLHQMHEDGLPVPPAAFVSTELWQAYQKDPKKTLEKIKKTVVPEIVEYLKSENQGVLPLVSVRSAGAVSMPGMMDTVLNVGVNQKYFKDLGVPSGKKKPTKKEEALESFAADNYARFLSMYGHTVLGMDKDVFPTKKYKSVAEVEAVFSDVFEKKKQKMPSQKPEEQILACILAVFDSWHNKRAKLYRELNNIDENAGTAVVIQQMVFGNKNDLSATGVMFSRNPSTGVNELTGEYLVCAQGEDVVSGAVTPEDMGHMKEDFPKAYEQLKNISSQLEKKYKQMQDIEFTIEDEKVYILQCRTAKCSPFAKLKMLMDMQKAQEIEPQEVFQNLSKKEYLDLNVKQVDPGFSRPTDGEGLPASMGALSGRIVFGPSSKYKEDTIFVAKETTPDDLEAIQMSTGILTASGGATSHAAVVARGMGKVCVVGCSGLTVDTKKQTVLLGGKVLTSGDWITMDAGTGKVWAGKDVPIIDAQNTKLFWDLEQLVMDAHPNWHRVTSKVDEIVNDAKTYFLTYDFDDKDPDFVKNELRDALDYLTGTMDLTGKLDFLEQKYPGQFLFSEINAQKIFLEKKGILQDLSSQTNLFEKAISVYLGPYEKDHAADFRAMGFKILPKSSVVFNPQTPPKDQDTLVVSQTLNSAQNLAISSKNALLGMLK